MSVCVSRFCLFCLPPAKLMIYNDEVSHPLLKQTYTGPETTSVGDLDFSPRLAETKQNQQFLEKSGL